MRVKSPAVVSVTPATVRDIVQTYETVGSIEAPNTAKIAAKVTGRIEYLEVREGAVVTEGQVLVRIDPAEVEAQVGAARSAVSEARYRLEQAALTEAAHSAPEVGDQVSRGRKGGSEGRERRGEKVCRQENDPQGSRQVGQAEGESKDRQEAGRQEVRQEEG